MVMANRLGSGLASFEITDIFATTVRRHNQGNGRSRIAD
jgi:hypothetical protein